MVFCNMEKVIETQFGRLVNASFRSVETQNEYDEFRRSGGDKNCVMCAKFGDNDPDFLIVANRFPYAAFEGFEVVEHLMLVPRSHIGSLSELTEDELEQWGKICAQAERDGYSILSRPSGAATKSQFHLHTHLVKINKNRVVAYLK